MSVFQKIADVLRAAAGKDMAPPTSAIVVAAGSSTRMGGEISKQYMEIDGVPVLIRTLLAFAECAYIDEIVTVIRPDDQETLFRLKEQYGIEKPFKVVSGGATRAESVKNGFEAIDKKSKFVAIHDGARCLITPDMIREVLRAAYRYNAATAACTVTDTVKLSTERGYIERTVDREKVYLAQTPQAFHVKLYRAALANADGADYTDDNQLIERLGVPVKLVDTGADNIKITRPEDIERAEAIVKKRGAQP